MVQLSAVPDLPAKPLGARERNRLDRHRSYLRAALHVTFEEGLDALTMQRLAAEVGAAVGTIYTYFPSKGALVAEVQREAIERLGQSAVAMAAEVDAAAAGADPAVANLAALAGFGRFWLTAADTFPEEMQLLMMLLSDVTESVPASEGGRVVPAAFRLLGLFRDRLVRAVDAGTLLDGDPDLRTISTGAALTGCVQLNVVVRWDPELLDPARAGRVVLDGLLVGWGADPAALATAHSIVDTCTPLAKPLSEDL